MHLPPDLPVAGPAAVIQWLQAKGSLTFTGQPQTVAGLRTVEERRKAAALAFLGKEAMALEMHPVTLSFREPSERWLLPLVSLLSKVTRKFLLRSLHRPRADICHHMQAAQLSLVMPA